MNKINYLLLLLTLMSGFASIALAEESFSEIILSEQDIQMVTNGYNETASRLASRFPEGEGRDKQEKLYKLALLLQKKDEHILGLAEKDIYGALTSFLYGLWSSSNNGKIIDDKYIATLVEDTRKLFSATEFARLHEQSSDEDKRISYEEFAMVGNWMLIMQVGLKQEPSELSSQILEDVAESYLAQIGLKPNQLQISDKGHLSLPVEALIFNTETEDDWDIKYNSETHETVMIPPDLKAGEEYVLTLHAVEALGGLSVEKWFARKVEQQEKDLGDNIEQGQTEVYKQKSATTLFTIRRYKTPEGEWRIAYYTATLMEGASILQFVAVDLTDDPDLIHRYEEYTFYMANTDAVDDSQSEIPKDTRVPVASARISSRFGYRSDPFTKRKRMHGGMDFAAPRGTEVKSIRDGIVSYTGKRGGYGNVVEINHGDGMVSRYAHLKSYHVKKGQKVSRGLAIAQIGTTGRSTGSHLHLEVLKNGHRKNPENYLN